MEKLSLAQLDKRMDEMPMLPAVVANLLALNPDDDNYFEDVMTFAQQDPGFAMQIIKLSNSASGLPVAPIVSLREAVVRIGTRNIASLITSLAVIRVFTPNTQAEKNLWAHAIRVAVTARVIACTTSLFSLNPDQAYLCGLLHDIGRFMLFREAKELMNETYSVNWQAPQQLMTMEEDLYGVNHFELGGRICHKWGIPKMIGQVVEYHHNHELPKEITIQPKTLHLIKTVQQADLFSIFLTLNPKQLEQDPEKFTRELEDLCTQACGPTAMVNAGELQALANPIWFECEGIIKGMGID